MKRWERWTFGLLSFIVAVTGGAYFWMKYLLATDDPFAVVNHPWQSAMLSAHVVASPALLLMFGIILNSHIMRKLGTKAAPARKSGLTSLVSFFLMAASGYLLQVTTSDMLLKLLVAVHVTSGVLFSAVYVLHLLISVRLLRRSAAPLFARTA